jgi:N-acetylglutamate synthase-like GNAT family acetyltransferase
VAPEDCDGIRVTVAEQDGVVVGFARLAGEAPTGELAELFIEPAAVRRGVGRQLLVAAMDTARGLGMTELTIDSDPNAEPFYVRAGAIRYGWVPGLTPGRLLPRLRLRLGS